MLSSHSAGTSLSTVNCFTKSVIMSILVFRAAFTISDTTPYSPAFFPFFILLIISLTMSLAIKLGTLLTLSAWD